MSAIVKKFVPHVLTVVAIWGLSLGTGLIAGNVAHATQTAANPVPMMVGG